VTNCEKKSPPLKTFSAGGISPFRPLLSSVLREDVSLESDCELPGGRAPAPATSNSSGGKAMGGGGGASLGRTKSVCTVVA